MLNKRDRWCTPASLVHGRVWTGKTKGHGVMVCTVKRRCIHQVESKSLASGLDCIANKSRFICRSACCNIGINRLIWLPIIRWSLATALISTSRRLTFAFLRRFSLRSRFRESEYAFCRAKREPMWLVSVYSTVSNSAQIESWVRWVIGRLFMPMMLISCKPVVFCCDRCWLHSTWCRWMVQVTQE